MKALWLSLAGRFNRFSLRERRLLALALVGGILLIGFTLFIDPGLARTRSLRQSIDRQTTELAGFQAQLAALDQQLQADPDAARKAEIAQLEVKLTELAQRLQAAENGLLPPERMNALLETILRRHPGLRLVSLKTLKPVGILSAAAKGADKADAAAKGQDFDIYRHGVEVRLEGSFAELQAYVADLEKDQPGLLWGEIRLGAEEYPRNLLTVVVFTLSSDKAWLAI